MTTVVDVSAVRVGEGMTDEERDTIREAMGLPGFAWKLGMRDEAGGVVIFPDSLDESDSLGLDADDMATGGGLLGLLGSTFRQCWREPGFWSVRYARDDELSCRAVIARTLVLACCVCAIELGRWPGGEG